MGFLVIWLYAINDAVFQAANALVGWSWTLDALIALPLTSPVVKAGPIGACLFYVWWLKGSDTEVERRRSLILITLIAVFLIAPITKIMSTDATVPRPYLLAETVYVLDGGELVASRQLAYRPPLAGDMEARSSALRRGQIIPNDMASFPSDHAALFIALAAGIFLASRWAGLFALAWAIIVTLGSRMAVGMHSPFDILAGGAFGVAILLACRLAFGMGDRRLLRSVLAWVGRHEALAAALLFISVLEVISSMATSQRLVELMRYFISGAMA